MTIREDVPLAPFTTLRVGGPARAFTEVRSETELEAAIMYAAAHQLPLRMLGAGSNLLVADVGIDALVVQMRMDAIHFEEHETYTLLIADAGACWDDVVDAAAEQGLFGIENLAGIPGTMGGAVVQNIGAYGAELATVFAYAEMVPIETGVRARLTGADAAFAYRTSFFKQHTDHIIVRAALRLSRTASPTLTYADLASAAAAGTPLATPTEITQAIRAIRARKFPDIQQEGTAGSFFKNPSVSQECATALLVRFPGLPHFPQQDGTVKLSLAWILDHVLSLKGFSIGSVRLYEKQPLVLVARAGATAHAIDTFADDIAARVAYATGIAIEREVETFVARA